MTGLKLEIQQKPPFSSLEEEAFLNLLRTSDCLNRAFNRKIRGWGLTATQYNVLRILRGAEPGGLTCAAIGARMVSSVPDITRLLARLKAQNLVCQHRGPTDRRVVWTQITPAGLDLLRALDPTVRRIPAELLGHLSAAQLRNAIRLLEQARQPHAVTPSPASSGRDS
jgi:DNA-binding MarR family transcriptional regulator